MSSIHFNSNSYTSIHSGTRLIITGAVHGNETCGTKAIHRVIADIEAGRLEILSGSVTFVPVCNPLAYRHQRRHGERNLNRRLMPTAQPQEFEDHVANWLCPLLAKHEVLLDLHSFRGEGEPFVLTGPENNDGTLEPFQFADQELAMAQVLGVHRIVDGWLSTYALGAQRRQARLPSTASNKRRADAQILFGVGTTEYMRTVGGYGMTLECGGHEDADAPEVAYQAIINTLKHFGMIDGTAAPTSRLEYLRICDVVDKLHADDRFVRAWRSFDVLHQNDLVGIRHDGTEVRAQMDGRIIFPDEAAGADEEWFYVTRYHLQDAAPVAMAGAQL
ncbi:succinylglutamate desuccinylase/aspartoacylase family protein [Undibacterium sp. SXout7W]|uniref:succinylglutamate desuccinylase/aspartoacylase family protein n=1 Tax=Undibacterium sp. SXout7W TaxID=3413049 RepID=UPI003BF3712E